MEYTIFRKAVSYTLVFCEQYHDCELVYADDSFIYVYALLNLYLAKLLAG